MSHGSMILDAPSLRAVPFQRADPVPIELLSNAQRAQLARHAIVRTLPARAVVYTAGADAESVFMDPKELASLMPASWN